MRESRNFRNGTLPLVESILLGGLGAMFVGIVAGEVFAMNDTSKVITILVATALGGAAGGHLEARRQESPDHPVV